MRNEVMEQVMQCIRSAVVTQMRNAKWRPVSSLQTPPR
jgi:hypothetical protein